MHTLAHTVDRRRQSLRAAHTIVNCCIIMMFVQLLACYAANFQARMEGSEISITYRVAAWAPLLLVGMTILNCHGSLAPVPDFLRPLMSLAGLTALLATVLAPTHALMPKYVIGDFLRYVTAWFAFYALVRALETIRQQEGMEPLARFADRYAYVALFDALASMILSNMYRGAHFSTGTFVYGMLWGMIRGEAGIPQRMLIVLACLAAGIVEGKRTTLAMSAVAFGTSMIWLVFSGQSKQVFRCAACLVIGGVILVCNVDLEGEFAGKVQDQIAKGLDSVINSASGEDVDRTLNYRYDEIRIISNHFNACNPLWCLAGLGFGAEISPGWLGGSAGTEHGNLHHAHNAFAIYFLRHGLVGIGLLSWFMLIVLAAPVRCLRSRYSDSAVSLWLFAATLFLAGYTGNLMMERVELPVIAALLLILTHEIRVRSAAPDVPWQSVAATPLIRSPRPVLRASGPHYNGSDSLAPGVANRSYGR